MIKINNARAELFTTTKPATSSHDYGQNPFGGTGV